MKQTFGRFDKPSIYIAPRFPPHFFALFNFFLLFHFYPINKIKVFKIHRENNIIRIALLYFTVFIKVMWFEYFRTDVQVYGMSCCSAQGGSKRTNEQFVSSMENRSTPPCRGSATAWSAVTSQRLTLYARLKWNNEEARFIHRSMLAPLTCNANR